MPSLIYELNEIIADPLASAGDIGRVVSKSPSLAALLLKIVNSAFYGFRSKIDSISRAVTLIGSKEVSHLALGITIMETFRSIPRHVIDVASFLEHNLACGIVSRIIAAHGNIAHTEQMFVSGMLHDIGRLVLCKYFPQLALQTFATASREQCPLMRIEQELLGCTHAHLGKKLLHKWKLPYSLENNVAYHHNPSAAPNPECAATIQMADMIVHGLGVGTSGETMIPAFDTKAWSRVNWRLSGKSCAEDSTMSAPAETAIKKLQARVDHLEENRRFIQNTLEMVLAMTDFPIDINDAGGTGTCCMKRANASQRSFPFRVVPSTSWMLSRMSSDPPSAAPNPWMGMCAHRSTL